MTGLWDYTRINDLITRNGCSYVAIDGRCASGKTTLAEELQEHFGYGVIHMDDFFLRPEQRSAERLQQPGGNVDYERFIEEVLNPLRQKEAFVYRPFSCRTGMLAAPISYRHEKVTVVEGSYSCHPAFWDYYDCRIFLSVSKDEQRKRLMVREGEARLHVFLERWIPLEEKYFETFHIEERCDYSQTANDAGQD